MDLIKFYNNEEPFPNGAFFRDILAWNDNLWEANHDHIQWLFPTKRPSNFNIDAVVLTPELIQKWKENPALRCNLLFAFYRFLQFLGLKFDKDGQVQFVEDPSILQKFIWSRFNHNYLRITRVLDSMVTLGLVEDALAFYSFLKNRYEDGKISDNTFAFWTDAINGKIL